MYSEENDTHFTIHSIENLSLPVPYFSSMTKDNSLQGEGSGLGVEYRSPGQEVLSLRPTSTV